MKALLLNSFLFIILFQSSAQNLVPNPSFEIYDTCPQGLSNIQYAIPWFKPTWGTSDFLHTCSSWPPTVPQNFFGYQQPHSGDGFAGAVLAYPNPLPIDSNYREYVEVELTQTMVTNQTYFVSFYLSLSDSSRYSTDRAEVIFSPDSVLNYGDTIALLSMTADVSNPLGNFLIDKLNWTFISGTYVAQGSEKFMCIGNFQNDTNTDTQPVQGGSVLGYGGDYAYYYIDDICVSTDSVTCAGAVGINELSKQDKKLVRVVDTMGRETENRPNTLLIYVFSDGTTKKVYRVE